MTIWRRVACWISKATRAQAHTHPHTHTLTRARTHRETCYTYIVVLRNTNIYSRIQNNLSPVHSVCHCYTHGICLHEQPVSTSERLNLVQGKSKDFSVHAMKTYRGSSSIAPLILNFGVDGGEWLSSRPCRFTPGANPDTRVGPREELDVFLHFHNEQSVFVSSIFVVLESLCCIN
jgi:hypothetical protein